jgi:pilus assembly protein CpaF
MAEAQRARSNRRIDIRKAVLWSATLIAHGDKSECRIVNISTTGAKVRSSADLAIGEQITLVIRTLGEFRGRIVWAGGGEVGVHFLDASGEELAKSEPAAAGSGEAPSSAATAPSQPAPAERQPAPSSPASAVTTPAAAPPAATLPDASAGAAARAPAQPLPTVRDLQARARDFTLPQRVRQAIAEITPPVNALIDPAALSQLTRQEVRHQLVELVTQVAQQKKLALSANEHRQVVQSIFDDMMGLGPLEPLLADDGITDILVNGADRIYVERRGKLELTGLSFTDDRHAHNIAMRIVTKVGRRIDEASPMADARLPDGSRVNVVIPPLALVGPMISIRKFAKKEITLDVMARQGNLSPAMATVLSIAARCRLNVLISGGTGSGKTTLLNAMSQLIDPTERIITIEDAAELQLQLPHVGGLETRIANLEGKGEVTMRDLLKNALRMRPDRIILGEIRGAEAFDMLQAMNTGHDGSLGTIHASGPREALARFESIIAFAGLDLPARTVRTQIASAIDLIVQISRMRDGRRRIVGISELTGMEGDVFTTQDLFTYQHDQETPTGQLAGRFVSSGLRPHFTSKAEFYNMARALADAMNLPAHADTPN